MKSQNDFPRRPVFRLVVAAALLNLGCASLRKPEAPVKAMAADAGLADAIDFRDAPDPVDVPSTLEERLSLPAAARRALDRVSEERAWDRFRLTLLDEAGESGEGNRE